MPRMLLALVLLPMVVVAAPVPKSLKNQRPRIDGLWNLTEAYICDRRMEGGITIWWVSDNRHGDAMSPNLPDGEVMICTLDASVDGQPGEIEISTRNGNGRWPGMRPSGTIEANGDTLRLTCCVDLTRPKDMQPAEGRIVYGLKRVEGKPKM